ncbi:MAG: thioredoxin [Planctomycetes bacterium]|nr:thioredoxin [Planctomycetota bacterium]
MTSYWRDRWPLVAVGLLVALAGCVESTDGPTVSPPAAKIPLRDPAEGTTPTQTVGDTAAGPQLSRVELANDANFRDVVLKSEVPVLVDFHATWCGPCKIIAPVLDELSLETPGVKVVKVDIDESPGLAAEYNVEGVPSLFVFSSGRVVYQHVGLASKAEMLRMLARGKGQ